MGRKKGISLSLTYAFCYSIVCLQYIYFTSYLFYHLKFSGKSIALIYGGIPFVAMFAQPFWGQIADKTQKTSQIIFFCIFFTFFLFLPILFFSKFLVVAICLWSISFFMSCIPPLLDSLTIKAYGMKGYGRIRVWGSVGFGSTAIIFMFFPLSSILYIISICGILCLSAAFFLENSPEHSEKKTHKVSLFIILKNKEFLIFISFSIIYWANNMPYNIILDIHKKTYLTSVSFFSSFATGLSVFLGIVAECLYFSTSGIWLHWRTPRFWLMVSTSITALRWALMSHPIVAHWFVLLQFLHGFSFGVFFIASVSYLTSIIPEDMRASGQTLFTGLTFGLGSILGNSYTGFLLDTDGKGFTVFAFSSFIALIALIFLLFIDMMKSRNLST